MQTALFIFIKRKWTEDQNIFNKFIDYYNKIEKKFMVCLYKICLSSNDILLFLDIDIS